MTSSLTALRYALQRSGWARDLADQFVAARRKDAERLYAKAGPGLDRSLAGYLPTSSRWPAAGVDALGDNDDVWRTLPAELLKIYAPEVDLSMFESTDQSLRTVLASRLVGQEYELVVLAAHGHRNPLGALSGGVVLRSSPEPRGRAFQPVFGRRADTGNVPYLFQDLPSRDLAPELSPSRSAELLSVAELEHRWAHVVWPLVVLLGCSTGRPVIHPGDQPQSLAEVFLRIGAAAVVAPMWDVRMPVVREWATLFLERLGGRTDCGRAAEGKTSRDAQRCLKRAICRQLFEILERSDRSGTNLKDFPQTA
ncbi:CHAT domain-containing protein [Streptomyces sp. NPDC087859]|uniref:CHAT domain-containing protein n=1 Tax=Streptomyces sp. NPDC087859 TaxID=3365812 RepID=UPI0037F3B1E8